jgi:predicted small secreted protein
MYGATAPLSVAIHHAAITMIRKTTGCQLLSHHRTMAGAGRDVRSAAAVASVSVEFGGAEADVLIVLHNVVKGERRIVTASGESVVPYK